MVPGLATTTRSRLNRQGKPHISYLDYTGGQLKYALRTPTGWQIQVIDALQWFGGFTSLFLDSADRPHMSYAGPPRGVRYARWTGDAWEIIPIDADGWFTSLALDTTGHAHIVYHDWNHRGLEVVAWNGADWDRQTADKIADVGQDTALVAQVDQLAVSYYEAGRGDLRVAKSQGDRWTVETVDAAADVGRYTSLALNAEGLPRVSYYDVTHGDLKVARRSPNRWVVETVDAAGDVGLYTSLALDEQGHPRISFYDPGWRSLRLAWGEPFGVYMPLVTLHY